MKNVCLDMDEVLVDLNFGLCRSLGKGPSDLDSVTEFVTEFDFEKIFGTLPSIAYGGFDAEWWRSLPPTGWKDAVVEFALSCADDGWNSIYVVTALPWQVSPAVMGQAAQGKIEWCREYLPQVPPSRIIFARPKPLLADRDTVLIDDRTENLKGFGLNAVLIPSRWNGLREYFTEFGQAPAAFLASKYGYLSNSH